MCDVPCLLNVFFVGEVRQENEKVIGKGVKLRYKRERMWEGGKSNRYYIQMNQ